MILGKKVIPSLRKQLLVGFGSVFALIIILGTVKFFQISAAIAEGKKHGPPASAISTIVTKQQPWQDLRETVAEVQALQGAMLAAESAGRVSKVLAQDGASVKQGDLLVELDDSVEKASYQASRVQADLLYKTFERKKNLFDKKAISADEFDRAQLTFRASKLEADSLKATWERKFIRAPFDGVVGVRRVNPGQYVELGDPIIPLHNTSELYLYFDVSQIEGPKIKVGDKITYPSLELSSVELSVQAVDTAANGFGKTYRVKSNTFSSTSIRPGEFIRIAYGIGQTENKIVIPSSAINYAPYGDSVYVVEKKDKQTIVNPKFIKVIGQRGDLTAISTGLNEGEEIATSGVFKLRPGATVLINNENSIKSELNPTPANS